MSKQTKQGWEPSDEILGVLDDVLWEHRARGDGLKCALIAAVQSDPLLSAAKEMQEALEAENALIVSAQELIASYFPPDGISKDALINGLIELFDGPRQREAQERSRAALAKSRGEGM